MKTFLVLLLLFNCGAFGFFACALFHEHGGQWWAALVGVACSGSVAVACGVGLKLE